MVLFSQDVIVSESEYRNSRREGTPVLAFFRRVFLHNPGDATAEKGSFGNISSRAFLRGIGDCSHPPSC